MLTAIKYLSVITLRNNNQSFKINLYSKLDASPSKQKNNTQQQKSATLLSTEKQQPVRRLITRRQSISTMNITLSNGQSNRNSQQTHSLRNRLSVPLTKVDKH